MTYRPPEPGQLVFGHGFLTFLEGGDRKGVGKGERSARFGLEEELMGDTAVFVFVASSLANVLEKGG